MTSTMINYELFNVVHQTCPDKYQPSLSSISHGHDQPVAMMLQKQQNRSNDELVGMVFGRGAGCCSMGWLMSGEKFDS